VAISAESCRVALLGRDDGARRQLRHALQELGAAIAFEGEPSAASGPSALGASLDVVIVNLEEGLDDVLDHLQAVLDDPAINVVFNDADASRALEGWDLARWARHLAAKVLGHGETMPPVPEGAERLGEPVALFPTPGPVPTPADLAPEPDVAAFIEEAVGVSASVPVDELPEALEFSSIEAPGFVADAVAPDDSAPDSSQGTEPELGIDFDQLADALGLADGPVPERVAPTPEAVASEHLAIAAGDEPVTGVVEVLLEHPAPEQRASEDDAVEPVPAFEAESIALEIDLDVALSLDVPAPTLLASTPEVIEAAAVADEALVDAEIEHALALDAAVPELEALMPEAEVAVPLAEEFVEFSWEFGDATAPDASAEADDDGADVALVLESPAAAAAAETLVADQTASWSDAQELPGLSDATDDHVDSISWDSLPSVEAADSGANLDVESWSFGDGSGALENEAALALDDEVAALAAQLDAFDLPDDSGSVEEFDFSAFDAPADTDAMPALAPSPASDAPPASAPAAGGLGLALAPLDDDAKVETEAADAPAGKPAYDFSNLDKFSLEPIEGEDVDPLMVAMGLVDAPAAAVATATAVTAPDASPLGHVFVLGASIGGPDAVRTFLSALPADLPAVFLLVQHLESGYFERLAQQLQKASALPVRIASAEAPAKQGEVLVIPAAEHIVMEVDGTLLASAHQTPPRYTPSIDMVLQDVADRFGRNATAIIFSGMAGDAVEGAAYLTTKGGDVWAQDPQSCVVSSMVDGARARGVVEFTGSPRELAQRCVARLAR
jgi:chemotaxis response regulator CheB